MRVKQLIFIICLLCLLCGCTNTDVQTSRLEVVEQNLRIQNIENEYKKLNNLVNDFNLKVLGLLYNDYSYDNVIDELNSNKSSYSKYFNNNTTDYYSTILTLKGMTYNKNNISISTYNMISEENINELLEFIILSIDGNITYIEVNWKNNVIDFINYY